MVSSILTLAELEAIYGVPLETSTVKEVDRITDEYRALIEASPFAILATSGPEGLVCRRRAVAANRHRPRGRSDLLPMRTRDRTLQPLGSGELP